MKPPASTVALAQGAFYATSGAWPLVHMPSFVRVTGPKYDLWLVETVGALLAVLGAGLLRAGRRRRVTPELALVGAGAAAVLAAIDTIYVARGRIRPVYLLDAVAEVALVAAWAAARRPAHPEAPRSEPEPRRSTR